MMPVSGDALHLKDNFRVRFILITGLDVMRMETFHFEHNGTPDVWQKRWACCQVEYNTEKNPFVQHFVAHCGFRFLLIEMIEILDHYYKPAKP